MIYIGVLGRAKHGKSLTATAIEEACLEKNIKCGTYEISQYVLQSLKQEGKVSPHAKREDLNPLELKLMIQHGHEKRKSDIYYWVDKIGADVCKDKPDVVLLPNIRFHSEAQFIKEFGGSLIRVTSLVWDGIPYICNDRDPNDPMETTQVHLKADYFLTIIKGQTKLLKMQAKTLFEYILKETNN